MSKGELLFVLTQGMRKMKKQIKTNNGEENFIVRLNTREGVGLLSTEHEEHYLILDSNEYWFDVIQSEYPKKVKCSCKNEFFTVTFDYQMRENEPQEVKNINIELVCCACKKAKKPIHFAQIDYTPSENLIHQPILFCKNPKIKLKYKTLSYNWTDEQVLDYLDFLVSELGLKIYRDYLKAKRKTELVGNVYRFVTPPKYEFEQISLDEAKEVFVKRDFIKLYFSQNELNIDDYLREKDGEYGNLLRREIWRSGEILYQNSPINETLYWTEFCTQYIDKAGNKQEKSAEFKAICKAVEDYILNRS